MKVNTVKSARKHQGKCEACREEITPGMGYRYIAPRHGGRRKRHLHCPMWRPSEMVSGKMATAMAAQEGAEESVNNLIDGIDQQQLDSVHEDLRTIMEECAQGARDCAEEYQEGLDNMPQGLQDGPTGEEIQEKIELLEDWVGRLEDYDPDEYDPDEEETVEDWSERLRDEALDAINSLEA